MTGLPNTPEHDKEDLFDTVSPISYLPLKDQHIEFLKKNNTNNFSSDTSESPDIIVSQITPGSYLHLKELHKASIDNDEVESIDSEYTPHGGESHVLSKRTPTSASIIQNQDILPTDVLPLKITSRVDPQESNLPSSFNYISLKDSFGILFDNFSSNIPNFENNTENYFDSSEIEVTTLYSYIGLKEKYRTTTPENTHTILHFPKPVNQYANVIQQLLPESTTRTSFLQLKEKHQESIDEIPSSTISPSPSNDHINNSITFEQEDLVNIANLSLSNPDNFLDNNVNQLHMQTSSYLLLKEKYKNPSTTTESTDENAFVTIGASTNEFNSSLSLKTDGEAIANIQAQLMTIPVANYSYNNPFKPNYDILEQLSAIVKDAQDKEAAMEYDRNATNNNLITDISSNYIPGSLSGILPTSNIGTGVSQPIIDRLQTNDKQKVQEYLSKYQQQISEQTLKEHQQNLQTHQVVSSNLHSTEHTAASTVTSSPASSKPSWFAGLSAPVRSSLSSHLNRIPNTSTSTKQAIRSPENDRECLNPKLRYGCAHCGAMVMCINTEAFLYQCDHPRETCQKEKEFGGGVCRPGALPECSCKPGEPRKPDPFDSASYVNCVGEVEMSVKSCKKNEEFHFVKKRCVVKPDSPRCTALGTFPNPNDCRWYYVCLWPPKFGNFYQLPIRCSNSNEFFSSVEYRCMPRSKMTKDDPCKKGRRPDASGNLNNTLVVGSENILLDNKSPVAHDDLLPATHSLVEVEEESEDDKSNSSAEGSESNPVVVRTPVVIPVLRASAVTTTTSSTTTTQSSKTTATTKYTCPVIVVLVVYWFPGVVNYVCSIA